jgi:NAD(P)-dependent dehydrogenase (short-subunit alcohol dehydrogenase family)
MDDGLPAVNKRDSNHRPLCLVTGANSGIGFETARGLARRDTRVILACRDRAKGEAARSSIASETGNPDIELMVVDVASRRSMRVAAQKFSESHSALDVLVNNAAVGPASRQQSPDEIELTFATNVLGYYLFTELLLSALRSAAAARVVNVASRMAYGLDLTDVEFKRRSYDPLAAYAQSKQADRMLTWALARRLEGTSVTANAVTPGVVNTKLLRALAPRFSGRTPAEGADPVLWLATSPEVVGVSGRFWADRRQEPCEFRNRHDIEALYAICERLSADESPGTRTIQ